MKVPFLLGRLIFGGFFLQAGIHQFKEREMLAQYAGAKNVPMPDVAVTATGVALTIGGASILLGDQTEAGDAGDHGLPGRRFADHA